MTVVSQSLVRHSYRRCQVTPDLDDHLRQLSGTTRTAALVIPTDRSGRRAGKIAEDRQVNSGGCSWKIP
jgi:uncharacterized protein with gpF-like domain